MIFPADQAVDVGLQGVELDTAADLPSFQLRHGGHDLERHHRILGSVRLLLELGPDFDRREHPEAEGRLLGIEQLRAVERVALAHVERTPHHFVGKLTEAGDVDRAVLADGPRRHLERRRRPMRHQVDFRRALDRGVRVASLGVRGLDGALRRLVLVVIEGLARWQRALGGDPSLQRREDRRRTVRGGGGVDLGGRVHDRLALAHEDLDADMLRVFAEDAPGPGVRFVVAAFAVVRLDARQVVLQRESVVDRVLVEDPAKQVEELRRRFRGDLIFESRDLVLSPYVHLVDRRAPLRDAVAAAKRERHA